MGINAQSSDATKQNYGVRLYTAGASFLSACHAGGVGHTAFGHYAGAAGISDWVYSMGITYTAAGAQVVDPAKNISGTYTPTLTGVANVTSATAVPCQYLQVQNAITVSGYVSIVAVAGAGLATELLISLPIASNLVTGNQCAGTATYYSPTAATSSAGVIRGDGTNDKALLQFNSYVAGGPGMTTYFTFTYSVI